MLDYVYAAVWVIMALLLMTRFGKENRVFYVAGGFFLLLAGCWLVRPIFGINLFVGYASFGLRGIIAALLLVLCLAYYREAQKSRTAEDEKHDEE